MNLGLKCRFGRPVLVPAQLTAYGLHHLWSSHHTAFFLQDPTHYHFWAFPDFPITMHSSYHILSPTGASNLKIRYVSFPFIAHSIQTYEISDWTGWSGQRVLSGGGQTCTKVLVTQSCLTLCDPMNTAHQASLSMGFSRQEHWIGLPFPSWGDLPTQGSNLGLLYCWQTLYHLSHQGSPA